jgi:hypothetical protein
MRNPSPVSKHSHIALRSVALLCGVAALAGCGQAGRPGATLRPGPRIGVKADRTAKLPGHSSVAQSTRFFSPDSFWNQAPSPDAPLDEQSPLLVGALGHEVSQEEQAGRGPWINTTSFSVPILTVGANQATKSVTLDHAPDAALSAAWSAVPLPSAARASQGSDGNLVVWQPSSDRMWDFWRLQREGDGWHAAWGGAIEDASRNPGVYGPDAWPGAKPWWGATASSLALAGGVMTINELRRGQIDHALAIAVPDVRAGVFASPAQRTDGTSLDPSSLPEGARLRLDPRLNLASLEMPPFTRMMAVAAQRYGIVVRDYASNVAFIGQDPLPTGSDPYRGPGGLFDGEYPAQLLASFPWAHLQVLKMDLHQNP